jgi:hypothetical protein
VNIVEIYGDIIPVVLQAVAEVSKIDIGDVSCCDAWMAERIR